MMETVEVIKSVLSENLECEIPDNVIHIVFPQSPTSGLENENVPSIALYQCNKLPQSSQLSSKNYQEDDTPLQNSKNSHNYFSQSSFSTECETTHKILISTKGDEFHSLKVAKSEQDGNVRPENSSFTKNYLHDPNIEINMPMKLGTFKDASFQTEDVPEQWNANLETLNLFFCTFHPNNEAETYCNNAPLYRPSIGIEELREAADSTEATSGIPVLKERGVCESKIPKEHRIRSRRKRKMADDVKLDGEEDDKKTDDLPPYPFATTTENLYSLRPKRLSKKFSDIFYSFGTSPRRMKMTGKEPLRCTLCPEEFFTFRRLEKHALAVHNSSTFSFPCNICGATFTRPHNLDRHTETRHSQGEKRFLCEICGRRFSRQDILAAHINLIHAKVTPKPKRLEGKRQLYHCSTCNKYFSRLQNFSKHQKEGLRCSKCLQTFACKTNLLKHIYKQHTAVCNICDKICTNKQQLYFHKMTHMPKYNCKYCSKGFPFEAQFIVHMATHTGNKPLQCDVCAKSFAHKSALQKHKWQEHTEASKRYPCEFCSKTFVYRAKLESHSRTHTGDKPFACHFCSASFSHNCNLSAHLKGVHGPLLASSSNKEGLKEAPPPIRCRKRSKKSIPTKITLENPSAPPPQDPQSPFVVRLLAPRENPKVKRVVPIAPRLGGVSPLSESYTTPGSVYQILYTYSAPTQ